MKLLNFRRGVDFLFRILSLNLIWIFYQKSIVAPYANIDAFFHEKINMVVHSLQ